MADRDMYQKRSLFLCIGIVVFVVATICTALGVYFGNVRKAEGTKTDINGTSQAGPVPLDIQLINIPENNLVPIQESDPNLIRPNVLFITLDDLRPALGCYGDDVVMTPNIDQIAEKGFVFRKAFAQQALCAPSRTSFLTSRRPDSLHLYDAYSYWRETVGNFTTMPQHFKENGYHTASIGKIFHHGIASNFSDDYPYSWSSPPYQPSTQKYKMKKVCPSSDGTLQMNLVCPVDVSQQPGGSLPDLQNLQEAIKFLKAKQATSSQNVPTQPFFLGIGFYKPHIPLKFPKEYLGFYPLDSIPLSPNRTLPENLPRVSWNPWTDIRLRDDVISLNLSFPYGPVPDYFQKYIRQSYYAAISYVDDLIGQLLLTLEETGFAKNTAIVLLGDHGWSLGEHQEWSKYSTFEVATNVPLIIVPPGKVYSAFKYINLSSTVAHTKQGPLKFVDQLVELVDLYPTLAEIAQIEKPPICLKDQTQNFCTEGRSLVPLMKKPSGPKWKSAVFSQYPRPSLEPQEDSDQPKLKDIKVMGYSMRTMDYRYTEWIQFDTQSFSGNWSNVFAKELYFHNTDSGEMNNVAGNAKYKNLVHELSKKLKNGWRNA